MPERLPFDRRDPCVGVVTRSPDHVSLELYRQQIVQHLQRLGVDCRPVGVDGPVPAGCDVLWEPALGMREIPAVVAAVPIPVVTDVVGLRTFGVAIEEMYADAAQRQAEAVLRERVLADWMRWGDRFAAVIATSDFMAAEISRTLGVPRARVHRSYPGVDRELFRPDGERVPGDAYFLHVSTGDAHRKNTPRVLAAYARLPVDRRPPLVLKALGGSDGGDIPGVRVVPEHVEPHALARWYRGALALVYPSLYEGFGLPIVEAMASGCPVITARTTACTEVGGDAVWQVDPWSTDDIADGLRRLMEDQALRDRLRRAGLARAQGFDWETSAREHREVFGAVRRRTLRQRIGRVFRPAHAPTVGD